MNEMARQVVVLTDEEMGVVVGADDPAVRPFADGPEAASVQTVRDARAATAARGLVARGLVVGDGRSATIEPALAAMLRVRREADVVVLAARRTDAGSDFWYVYRSGSEVVSETVSAGGLHVVERIEPGAVTSLARAALVDPEAPRDVEATALVRGPLDDAEEVEEVLARCRLGVDLASRRAGGATWLDGLWSGPDGCWHVDLGRSGSGTPAGARPVGSEQLLAVFLEAWTRPRP